MEKLIEEVESLSDEELKRANEKFPLFNSNHEGYAVIKEEMEEASCDLNTCFDFLKRLWVDIKCNDSDEMLFDAAETIKEYAIHLAAESIQTAAMAQKFIDSFNKQKDKELVDKL